MAPNPMAAFKKRMSRKLKVKPKGMSGAGAKRMKLKGFSKSKGY
jgi:hypothetical protein